MCPKSSISVFKSIVLCNCVWSAFGASTYGWTPYNPHSLSIWDGY